MGANTQQAISALRKFAEKYATVEDGATLRNAQGRFERVIRIEREGDSDSPIQAWVNRSDNPANSIGVNFKRKTVKLTYGNNPFCGDRSCVDTLPY